MNENLQRPLNFSPLSCLPQAIFQNLSPPLKCDNLSVKLHNEYKKVQNSPTVSEALTSTG